MKDFRERKSQNNKSEKEVDSTRNLSAFVSKFLKEENVTTYQRKQS